jgi:hypothetical protein
LVVRKVTFTAGGEPEYSINPELAEALSAWWHEMHSVAMRDTVYPDLSWAMDQRADEMRLEWHSEV